MRKLTLTLTTALAALTIGACGTGSDNSDKSPSSSQDKALDGALKFARCMRGEGIDFPDPQKSASGLVRVGGPRQNPENPHSRTAAQKCGKHLQDGGDAPDPAQQAKLQDAFVKYARCMRAAGVDVPDPEPGAGGLLADRRDPGAPNPESPAFKGADRKCDSILAAVEERVQSERSP